MARHDMPFSAESAPSATNSPSYLIDPREIQIREEYSGRHEEPEIDDLLEDFLNPDIGQIQPCVVTKDDGAPVLLVGSRRWRTAIATPRQMGSDGIPQAGGIASFQRRPGSRKEKVLRRYPSGSSGIDPGCS